MKGIPTNGVHMQRDGSLIAIKDMTDNHLINTIKLILRKANEGVVVRWEG